MLTKRFYWPWVILMAAISMAISPLEGWSMPPTSPLQDPTEVVVFGYNDLGMHCMNDDFSELLILPPFNNLHAQVVDRSENDPNILTSDVTVHYSIPGNTHSADKTNFWKHVQALFGVALPPDIGLTGNGMSGQMSPTPTRDWAVTGIPITPHDDNGRLNPYPLALIKVYGQTGLEIGRTQSVVPVSQELSCNLCHQADGVSPELDILRADDRLHGTHLETSTPVLCAQCHADNA